MSKALLQPTPEYRWKSFAVDANALLLDHEAVVRGGSWYAFGSKDPASRDPKDVDGIDCSGYVRYLLGRRGIEVPDGSQNQGEWARNLGLKESSADAGLRHDNVLRLAVLPVTRARKVGHVVLILNGRTIESHGGVGPDRREWTALPWRDECKVYVVTRPS